MGSNQTMYRLRADSSADAVLQSLRALLRSRLRPMTVRRSISYDTFDGRLRRAGMHLDGIADNGQVRLRWAGTVDARPRDVEVAGPIGFAWDLPAGPVRESLAPVIEMRRLLPLVEIEGHAAALEVMNDDDKMVARVRVEQGRARAPGSEVWSALPVFLRVLPVRGYDAEHRRLSALVESRPGVEPCSDDLLGLALEAIGCRRDVRAKPRLVLAPDVTADAGLRAIFTAWLDVIVANEAGVRADLDSEFLHDFRVAVRRTRALIGQVDKVLPAAIVESAQREFAWLGEVTGPTRDLDVFALRLQGGAVDLSAADLDALRTFIAAQQRRAHAELVGHLDSPRYARWLGQWRQFLADPSETGGANNAAGQLLREVAGARIWKTYRRLVEQGRQLSGFRRTGGAAATAALHEVRLRAKKLRYLVDATRSVFDAGEIGRIVGSLKKLQALLGDFNDAQVQAQHLLEWGEALGAGDRRASLLLGMGRMIGQCQADAAKARAQFTRRFAKFASDRNRARFRRVFKAGAR